jgi:hypothetical protein
LNVLLDPASFVFLLSPRGVFGEDSLICYVTFSGRDVLNDRGAIAPGGKKRRLPIAYCLFLLPGILALALLAPVLAVARAAVLVRLGCLYT